MKNKIKLRDYLAIPVASIGVFFILISLLIGGEYTTKKLLELFKD